jgi:hypothetical protein
VTETLETRTYRRAVRMKGVSGTRRDAERLATDPPTRAMWYMRETEVGRGPSLSRSQVNARTKQVIQTNLNKECDKPRGSGDNIGMPNEEEEMVVQYINEAEPRRCPHVDMYFRQRKVRKLVLYLIQGPKSRWSRTSCTRN